MYPAFMRSSYNDCAKFVMWNTGNYKYQIEIVDRISNKVLSTINYSKPYEFVSKEFDQLALTSYTTG